MKPQVKSKIWIEIDGQVFLGEGRVRLLRKIGETGSLSQAAKQLNMSYKKAWNLIDSANKLAPQALVEKSTGGKGGGGAALTSYGAKMIETFDSLNQKCWQTLDEQQEQLDF